MLQLMKLKKRSEWLFAAFSNFHVNLICWGIHVFVCFDKSNEVPVV